MAVTQRWQLSRAGITNVYQYVDETLTFAGGRLLLRGVNGSGKSTAMNMLLPFLLEADARRIDAAGEQSAVLRAWMLSGRDEAQPVGYLWIELTRTHPDTGEPQYLSFGCGIKANRSTDSVTTWWFLTDRRPGIDLALHERRMPLSVDSLRAELGTHAVFAHAQRPAYRQALRTALYGGRDIDQHLRLLHVVRSPRVGDRIDADLPEYLHASLPELSETALDDAAQPLEDLEEHRRNVEALTRTVDTLDALVGVYREHLAGDLRGRAERLRAAADAVRAAERDERRRRSESEAAATALEEAVDRVAALEADEHRLRAEIDALEDSEAYRHGQELVGLREHVATLTEAVERAEMAHRRALDQFGRAEDAVRSVATHTTALVAALVERFGDLDRLAVTARLTERPPSLPAVATSTPVDDAVDGVRLVPVEVFDRDAVTAAIGRVSAAARQRAGDVADVGAALDRVDALAAELRSYERDLEHAGSEAVEAEEQLRTSRDELHTALTAWRDELHVWVGALRSITPTGDGIIDDSEIDGADLLDRRNDLAAAWTTALDRMIDTHRVERSRLATRLDTEEAEIAALVAEIDELASRTHPDPPSALWQRADRVVCLADLVDFVPDLRPDEQRGLEAAMEAAGLLGAELSPDGSVTLVDGQLLALADEPVGHPLSAALTVTVPEELLGPGPGRIDPSTVAAVLGSVSLSVDGDAATAVTTAVTTDGRFRIGALRGRHTKAVAEHIGVTARRAAIERRRAEAAARLRLAEQTAALTRAALDDEQAMIDRLVAHRGALPSSEPLADASRRAGSAAAMLERARDRVAEAEATVSTADAAHAAGIEIATRLAATLGLPADRQGLSEVGRHLAEVSTQVSIIEVELAALVRSHHDWRERSTDRGRAAEQAELADVELQRAIGERAPVVSRLATLEDAVGADFREVLDALENCRRELDRVIDDLGQARRVETERHRGDESARAALITAESVRVTAEERCVAGLEPVRRALAVDGVLRAVGVESLSSPPATSGGARELADAVLAAVAPPTREVTADGVRISLRQRRDQLGAGWDAEDHQPDPALPLTVRVTGPLGQMTLPDAHGTAATQLDRQSSLLTAKQDQALRNLLQGLVAREVAEKMHAAGELVALMNQRLSQVTTAHGIGVRLTWRRRRDLDDPDLDRMIELLATPPDLRDADADAALAGLLSARLADARRTDPERRYRELVAEVLDYRSWFELGVHVKRPGRPDERLTRRTGLSEGEKKIVSYLPLFAAVAASCDALAESAPGAPRFVLLDDAFAKVSEDNHAQLFGLLVDLDLDFIATSERLWGTHSTVPELAITEVLRDAELGVIVLEHSRWDGTSREDGSM